MARKTRNAFTLVEMLVVIAIIGMLMAMVLPAIQQAREVGRMNTCRSNMRQIGIAMISYAEQRKEFPGYINRVGQPSRTGREDSIKRASWIVMLLPNMGHNDLWDQWNSRKRQALMLYDPARRGSGGVVFVGNFVCPSDFPEDRRLAQLSYVVNCGMKDRDSLSGEVSSTTKFKQRLTNSKANGIFHNHYRSSEVEREKPTIKVTTDFIENGDGMSNTMMISENIQAKNWSIQDPEEPGQFDVKDFSDGHLLEKYVGFIWGGNLLRINGEKDILDTVPDDQNRGPTYARPSCNHGGGVNVVMCDTSAHFVREGIDDNVYVQLMTPDHSQSRARDRTTGLLNDADWKN